MYPPRKRIRTPAPTPGEDVALGCFDLLFLALIVVGIVTWVLANFVAK